jgi:tetratricopeptide (TPR) repeat protein
MGRRRPTLESFPQWLKLREERFFLGDYKGALDAPKMTAHLGPKEQARSWALRAGACRQQRMPDEAVDAWEVAFSLAPHDPWVLSHFAVWQLYQGQFADALKTALIALENASPDHKPFARCIQAQALWFCGHRHEALSDFIAAAEQAPVNSPTQLASIFNIAVVFANTPDITPKIADLALELVADLRTTLTNRKLPRVRALLRWVTGLAEAAAGRKSAAGRDLWRARP